MEVPRSFDSGLRRRHWKRSREISMTECLLPDVRQHQDIVFPQRMHADSRRAVEIEGCTQDGDAGESQSPVPSHKLPVTSHQSLASSHFNEKWEPPGFYPSISYRNCCAHSIEAYFILGNHPSILIKYIIEYQWICYK